MAKPGEMTPKQSAFVREYLVDHNATRAYLRAGYRCSEQAAQANAFRMMANDGIASAIADAAKAATDVANLTVQDTLTALRRFLSYDVRKFYDADGKPLHVTQLDDDSAAAIVGIKVVTKGNAEMGFGEVTEFKLADKVATLEKAMKYHVLFKEDHKSQADALGEIVLKFVNANKR